MTSPDDGTSKTLRLGLYGGSFDPVHLGHLMVAQAAMEALHLDRLVFIPAARSPFKSGAKPAIGATRLRWLRLSLAGRPTWEVDDCEVRRGGISYTIDTVLDFRRRFPNAHLYWLIGADQVGELPSWHQADQLAEYVEFAVIPRPAFQVPSLSPPFRLIHLKGWPLAVSSSEIRSRIIMQLPVDHLLTPQVAEALKLEYPVEWSTQGNGLQ